MALSATLSAADISSMDDFLGTSIQYSEKQILRLEREYAEQREKEVAELIDSGYLDTDYETEDSESHSESDCKDLETIYDSPSTESSDDSKLDISSPPNRGKSEMDQMDSMSDSETVDVDDEKENEEEIEDIPERARPFDLAALIRDLSDLMGSESSLIRLSPFAFVL